MWRRMYIYTEEKEKGVWRKTQKHLQPGQDCLLVLGENRGRWYADEYLLKEQRV